MNKDILKGKLQQVKGTLKKQWGKLTDDDIMRIEGDANQLQGIIQERYGVEKEEAQRQIDAFMKRQ